MQTEGVIHCVESMKVGVNLIDLDESGSESEMSPATATMFGKVMQKVGEK